MTRSLSFLELPPKKARLKDGRFVVLRPPRADDAGKLLDQFNAILEENVLAGHTRKLGYDEELKWLNERLGKAMRKEQVTLVAEFGDRIVGSCEVVAGEGKSAHVGMFGITIAKDFRRVGLGKTLANETIRSAKIFIEPKIKIVELWVVETNKSALGLYKKLRFKKDVILGKRIFHKGKYYGKVIMSRPI